MVIAEESVEGGGEDGAERRGFGKGGKEGFVEGVGVFEEEEVQVEFAVEVKRGLRLGGRMGLEEVEEGGGEVFGVGELGEGGGEGGEVEEGGVEGGDERVGEEEREGGEERRWENHGSVGVAVAVLQGAPLRRRHVR